MNKSAMIAYLSAANAAFALPADSGGSLPLGVIAAANASRFDQQFQNIPLTNYAQGWKDGSDLDAQLDFLAPAVDVPDRFNYREFLNSDAFLADTDGSDLRAIGSDFKKVEFGGTEKNEAVQNKGLTITVETRDLNANPNRRNQIVDQLMRRLKRNELIRAHALALAASVATAKTWGSSASPDSDIRADLILAADSSGVRPNRVFVGETAWDKRISAYEAQATAGAFQAPRDAERLGQYLNARVLVGSSRYQSGTASKSQIGGSAVLLFYAEEGLLPEDMSNIKRFTALCDDGSRIRVFEQQLGPKLTAITIEHYSKIVVTSTLGMRALTIS